MLVEGTNILAVEIHQESPDFSDVSFDLALDASLRPVLQPLQFGKDRLLFWSDPDAVLEEASSMAGPWTPVGAASPAAVDSSAAQTFYRLAKP